MSNLDGPHAYSLKSVRINQQLSDETTCFSAELYYGKNRVASVSNRGNGGLHEIHFRKASDRHAFEAWALSQPHEFDFEIGSQAIDAMLAAFEVSRAVAKIRRQCSTQTLFTIPGASKGSYGILKCAVDRGRAIVSAKYPGALLLNDASDSEVMKALGIV